LVPILKAIREYVYVRSKSVFINDDGEQELFLFSCLTVNTYTDDDVGQKKKIRAVVSELIEIPINEALPLYLDMEDHEFK